MTIRLHSVVPHVEGYLRITGDALDFDVPQRVEVWQCDTLIVEDHCFNPNFYEPTSPTSPRRNLFILDVEASRVRPMMPAPIKLTVHERDVSSSVEFSITQEIEQCTPRLEPNPEHILSSPREFDRQLDVASHRNVKAIYPAIMSLAENGILRHIPLELRVKWLDLAVFSVLCDGVNSLVLDRLGGLERQIEACAPGSYAESSVRASRARIDGQDARAMQIYEDAAIWNHIDVSPWTSGMAGMNSISTLARFSAATQFFNSSFELVGPPPTGNATFLASADSAYFRRFGSIYLTSAKDNIKNSQLHYNVINPSEEDLDVMHRVISECGDIVSFSVSRYDVKWLDHPNRVGFYTLNRFLILEKLLRLSGAPILVTEADAKLTKESETILQQLNDHDVGYLAMQRYIRPWMHTTAPLVYANSSEAGRFFSKSLFSSIMASLVKTSGRWLWGIDQAAIYCALKYSELAGPPMKAINLTRFANAVIYQAQQHPNGKEGFLAEHAKHG